MERRADSPLGFRTSCPLALPENHAGHSYSYTVADWIASQATDPQMHFGSDHQTLEADLSLLNLSPAYHRSEPLPTTIGVSEPALYYSFDDHPRRQSYMYDAMYGRIDFQGAHRNRTAGIESLDTFPTRPGPTGVQPWYEDEYFSNGDSFLHRKEDSPIQLSTQYPVHPYSNRDGLGPGPRPTNSNRHQQYFNRSGSLFEASYMSRPRLYQRFLQQFDSLSLKDLRGQMVYMAKDQFCCRLLQKKFVDPNEEEIRIVLSEVIQHTGYLMVDQFGNHIIQKLVEFCNESQRTQIIHSITKTQFQLVSICLNLHGTRAVQKLVEHLTNKYQISLVMSFIAPAAVELAQDQNGHHVIQHCLKYFSNEENKHLINEIANNTFVIATNKSGCCVLQSCVDHSEGQFRAHLVSEIIANALHLAEDQYGNYVVQHILGLGEFEITENLLRQLEGNYANLSCNKYASNVVEKCLKESQEEQASWIIKELLRSPNAPMLLVHPFGNFVIQSALLASKGIMRNDLVKLVMLNAQSLRSNLYGKKVISCVAKLRVQFV